MNRIKQHREACGLTQNELANVLDVSQSTVAMWETEKALPRARVLMRLADVLDCTVDNLLGKEQEPNENEE